MDDMYYECYVWTRHSSVTFDTRLYFKLYKIFISVFMFILNDDAQVINPMFYVMRPLVACYWPVMHPNLHKPVTGCDSKHPIFAR